MSTFTLLCTFLSYTFLYPLLYPLSLSGPNWGLDETSRLQAFVGLQIDNSMGAITVDVGRPYVFVKAGDGNLWLTGWDGSAWDWSSQGLPSGVTIVASMGAITVDGSRPYVFIQGSDGNLWVNWWDGGAWHWSNQ